MLSWSAKLLNDSEMMGDVLTPKESRAENESGIDGGPILAQLRIVFGRSAGRFVVVCVEKFHRLSAVHALDLTQ